MQAIHMRYCPELVSFKILHRKIVNAIQLGADSIEDFTAGAIAIRYIAASTEAKHWMSNARPNRGHYFIYPIVDGGPTTRPAGWRGDTQNEALDCVDDALRKLKGCIRAMAGEYGQCSDDLPHNFVTEDISNQGGAICLDVNSYCESLSYLSHSGLPDIRIYVSVSGANDIEDKWCAFYALESVHGCIRSEFPERFVLGPQFDPLADSIISQLHLKPLPSDRPYTSSGISLPKSLGF